MAAVARSAGSMLVASLAPVTVGRCVGVQAIRSRPAVRLLPFGVLVGRPALGRRRLRPAVLARRHPMRRVVAHISIHGPGGRCRLMFALWVTNREESEIPTAR